MDKYRVEKKPEKLKILTSDEIGILTRKLNNILELIWIYTQDLKKKQKTISQAREKEKLVSSIIQASRGSLNIDKILNSACQKLTHLMNIERVSILNISNITNESTWKRHIEYKENESIKGVTRYKKTALIENYWAQQLTNNNNYIAINDIEKSNRPDYFKEFYTQIGVKSIIAIAIKNKNEQWGIMFLSKYYENKYWTKEDIYLLETISSQLFLALKQAQLYISIKQTAKRETLLRCIAEITREAKSYDKMEEALIQIIGKTYNADRCYFRYFDKAENKFLKAKIEYSSSEKIKSVKKIPANNEGLNFFSEKVKEKENSGIIKNTSKYIKQHNLEGSAIEQYLKELDIKSDYPFPMWDRKDQITWLVLHYTKKPKDLPNEDIETLEAAAKQISIAIDQIKLYEDTKEYAKKEVIIKDISNKIRSSLDIKSIKKEIVLQIAKYLKADKVNYSDYDPATKEYIISKESEYRSSEKVKSHIGIDFSKIPGFIEHIRNIHILQKKDIIFSNLEDYLKENNLKGTPIEKFYKDFGFYASAAINITYQDVFLGNLVITFNHPRLITKDDINFLRSITNQSGVAIHQAKLYEKEKQIAKKESIIRKIISEIKLSQNLDQTYNYILKKLTTIFKVNRTIFLEIPSDKDEAPIIKNEYLSDKELSSAQNKIFLKNIKEISSKAIENKQITTNYTNKTALQDKYRFKSITILPLIKNDNEPKILGIIAMFKENREKWTSFETDLMQAISETVVPIIWELTNLIEISKLKDIFIATLAHDLQVPLVGEEKALEFLLDRSNSDEMGQYKEFFKELKNNNQDITYQLQRLLESFYYEQGSKVLELKTIDTNSLINELHDSFIDYAKSKNINLSIKTENQIPNLYGDKKELLKALNVILDNAITYTQEGGEVIIAAYKEVDKTVICIDDNGPGIPKEIKDRMFNRYETAIATNRKIGAGLGLYISNLAIKAHNGSIAITTSKDKGTIFCINLPINQQNNRN